MSDEQKQGEKHFYEKGWFFIALTVSFVLVLVGNTMVNNSLPTPVTLTPTPSPISIPKIDNVGPKWDYVNLTPEIFNEIILKIKSAPNTEAKATVSGELSSVTFYYSFVFHDPCEPLLKDTLVLEIETITYVDKNGQKYPNGPITDYITMRDIDHDTYPEDYVISEELNPALGLCFKLTPLTKDTPDIDNLLSLWEAGMNYFMANLLK